MLRVLGRAADSGRILLADEEVHHLVRVRRASPGERFEAIDGRGTKYVCTLKKDGDTWYGEILQTSFSAGESPLKLTLGQALIQKDKFELVLQKATELGVHRIVPLVTARSEIRLNELRALRKVARWERILAEAAKQCGRAWIPDLSPPLSLGEFLGSPLEIPLLVLDEEHGIALRRFIEGQPSLERCTVIVGPEGGWGLPDREILESHQVIPINLGSRILRAETAPVVILSLLQYERGDLGIRDPESHPIAER